MFKLATRLTILPLYCHYSWSLSLTQSQLVSLSLTWSLLVSLSLTQSHSVSQHFFKSLPGDSFYVTFHRLHSINYIPRSIPPSFIPDGQFHNYSFHPEVNTLLIFHTHPFSIASYFSIFFLTSYQPFLHAVAPIKSPLHTKYLTLLHYLPHYYSLQPQQPPILNVVATFAHKLSISPLPPVHPPNPPF